ncbi:MAG: photoactive yellow protein [Bacteroidota bacterium]
MNAITFSDKDIFPVLEKSSPQEFDEMDFGVVQMDLQGTIKAYNKYESELAHITQSEAIGKNFFTQIAPCTNNFMVATKFIDAKENRDEVLDYMFTYRIKPTKVRLRLIIHPEEANQYLLVSQTI